MAKAYFYGSTSDFIKTFAIVDGDNIISVSANSGQKGYQDKYWAVGLGPIPPGDAIDNGPYTLSTTPRDTLPNQHSSMGTKSYQIFPDVIYQKNGDGVRRYIEMHFDANQDTAPGSAGCIAIRWRGNQKYGMNDIHDILAKLKRDGHSTIPLIVDYSGNNPITGSGSGHWSDKAMKWAIDSGIITNKRNHDAPVKWGEFVVVIQRLYNIVIKDTLVFIMESMADFMKDVVSKFRDD